MTPPGTLAEVLDLPPVSPALDGAIHRTLDGKTKPPGSLGAVETIAARIARIQGALAPRLHRCRLTLFAGDHGVAAEGVSAYPQAVTRQMVANFLAGGAAANVFARANGVELSVVDAGVAGAPLDAPGLLARRIAPGTRNFALEPAMTREQYEASLRTGTELGAEAAAAGEAAAFGEMGIANTSSAALIAHKLTGAPLDALIGRGTGLDDDGLARKRRVLARAAARTAAARLDAHEALTEYGGFEIVMMAGAMIGAARAGAVVVVDGFIASAAALAADRMAPALGDYLVFAHRSAEPGHRVLLDALGARPLLDLGLRLGEGTGALLAWPILRAAAAMLSEMASFESAGVSGPGG